MVGGPSVEPTRNYVVGNSGMAPCIFIGEIDQGFVEFVQLLEIIAMSVGGPMPASLAELAIQSQCENRDSSTRPKACEPKLVRVDLAWVPLLTQR